MPAPSRQSGVPLVASSGVSALLHEVDLNCGGGSEVCATRDGTIFFAQYLHHSGTSSMSAVRS
jgi:hypothetical protein